MIKVCFTGHRPNNKYLGGYEWTNDKNIKIMLAINENVLDILKSNPNEEFRFITGGALGIDQMAFHIINIIKDRYDYNIQTEIAVPFINQPNAWFSQIDKNRYRKQLELANKITLVDEIPNYFCDGAMAAEYNPKKMQLRNMYMVDNSNVVIAVWDGSKKGGTYNCIQYAKSKNKRIIYINPKDIN